LALDSSKTAKIIARWLDQQLADDEHQRAQGGRRRPQDIEATEAELSHVLDDYREALRENDFTLVNDDLASIESAENLKLDTAERKTLARELVKANITLLQVQKARLEGDYEFERALLPQRETARPDTTPSTGTKLSTLANKYVEFKTQDARWTEKTKQQNVATLNLFINIAGDIDAAGVKRNLKSIGKFPDRKIYNQITTQAHQTFPIGNIACK